MLSLAGTLGLASSHVRMETGSQSCQGQVFLDAL